MVTKEAERVQAVERALDLLERLGRHPQGAALGTLAAEVGLHKSTVHRLLHTLAGRGYVLQTEQGAYRLGLRLVQLASALLEGLDLRAEARPFLQELLDRTNEVVHLVVMEQGEIVYIDKLEGSQTVRMHSSVGKRVPAHCTAVGKSILAHLPEAQLERILREKGLPRHTARTITDAAELRRHLEQVRAQGYALDLEENEEGIVCVAAPIRNHAGQVVAAISVSAPAMRMGERRTAALIPLVRATAERISRRLGAAPLPGAAAAGGWKPEGE
ncbi:MAG: IclR family transcriptional regulator [Bacillota bacterium]|nr:IclR family transcriptional regulator [Bacillota bacterium]